MAKQIQSFEKIRKILKYFIIGVLLFLLLLFLFRNSLSRLVFTRLTNKFEAKYGVKTEVQKIGFIGLRTFRIDTLSLIPKNNDTIFHLHSAEIKLDLINLLFLKINPLEIKLDNPIIRLTGGKDSSNYGTLVHPAIDSSKIVTETSNSVSNLNEKRRVALMAKFIRGFFGLSTAKFIITNFNFNYTHLPYYSRVTIPYLETSKEGFETIIHIQEMDKVSDIKIFAINDKENNRILFRATADSSSAQIPLIYHKLGIKVSFDSLMVDLTAKSLLSNEIIVMGNSSVKNFEVAGKRISETPVMLNSGAFKFKINITPEIYEIDSTSTIQMNDISSQFSLSYLVKDKRVIFNLKTGDFEAQKLFNSLPKGLFMNLHGIKITGKINYSMGVDFSLNLPDSLKLESKLLTDKVALINLGNKNFFELNDTFTYKVYSDTGYFKSIFIGPQNNDFVPLEKISPYIKNAIITSEDGGFFYHKGFDIDGIRYAMAQNIKERGFVRGGSTITMQLIKNLYLNQNKNLFRKVEEYLIVWLIESNKMVSKERMLEIYLNIIEWAPGIYGVNDACKYYFEKEPSEVTLEEAIYLSNIVPKPSKFKYCFEKDGNLRPFMYDYFNFVGSKMLSRQMITQQEFDSLSLNVKLSGPAKNTLLDTSNFNADTLLTNELIDDHWKKDSSLLLQ